MPLIAVLEDDPRRIAEMQSAAASFLGEFEFHYFNAAHEMKRWLSLNLDRVQLVSLDCDLDAKALSGTESGSGEDVTAFLVQRQPKCAIVIHSSNALRAPAMHMELALAGCTAVLLCPFVDGEQWVTDIRKALTSVRSSGAICRDQAIQLAWGLFAEEASAFEVREVEAKLIDGTWSVIFYRHIHPDYVESPGFWLILVPASGVAEWFDVM